MTRVTTEVMVNQALRALQNSLARMSRSQTEIATGRRLTAPADDPEAAAAGTRLRSRRAATEQHGRQADAARTLLGQYDALLAHLNVITARAQELALRGANTLQGNMAALAGEANQLLEEVVVTANTEVDGRRLLGGQETLTPPLSVTRDASGQITAVTVNPRGINGTISVEIAPSVSVQTNLPGESVLGAAIDPTFLPQLLIDLRDDLAAGDTEAVRGAIDQLRTAQDRLQTHVAAIGGRILLVDRIQEQSQAEGIALQSTLSELLDADLARVTMELQREEIVYQAALAATARTIQPSLVDFLR
jgi:flagellar hook-associated protein 3 FlgL